MSRDDATLLDVVQHARLMLELLDGYDRDRFLADIRTQLAVVTRLFEILGEAVKRLSPSFRDQHPGVPWREIAGMRDFLIHGYDRIDLSRVWDAAIEDIPRLLAVIEPQLPPKDPDAT